MSNIKNFFDNIAENVVLSSKTTAAIVQNLQIVARETKNLLELVGRLGERLNQHEQILLKLVEEQNKQNKVNTAIEYTPVNKVTQKPN